MKKLTLGAWALLLFLASCQKQAANEQQVSEEPQAIAKRTCLSQEILEQQLLTEPGRRERMEQIEAFTQRITKNGEMGRLVNGTIEIPVQVHVVYNTTQQNISDAQIKSQIDVLNEDFTNTNADRTKLPSEFASKAQAGMNVRFVLQPVIRVKTKVRSWSTNDFVKSAARGGSNAVSPSTTLNVWVCNLGNGLLGYAQFPGGNPATDGVVCLYSAFGSKAKSAGVYLSPYDLGRTMTHEVGHWMNLRHIWGDDGTGCNGSDLVDDTNNQAGPNYGAPVFPRYTCSNQPVFGDMFMNYMDYTDDRAMYFFTAQQASRALAVFASGGPRAAIGQP